MATIVLRATKGSQLSNTELDANFSNLNNELISKLASSSYTAPDVLAKLLTVDGVGSGLDADLLDGLTSSTTLPVPTNKASIVARDSSGNFSANLITGTTSNANALNGVSSNGFISRINISNHIARIITGSNNDITVINGDGINGNPTISVGSNIPKRDSVNTYPLPQNFSIITANGLLNDGNNNLFTGSNNLSPTSTNGFLYVPMINGVPTSTPTNNTGRVSCVWDATNNRLYAYSGGMWNIVGNNIPTQSKYVNNNTPASTAYVMNHGLRLSPMSGVTANRNMSASEMGGYFYNFTQSNLTIGLPLIANGISLGSVTTFHALSTGSLTVVSQDTARIHTSVALPLTEYTIVPGASVSFVYDGSSGWIQTSNSGADFNIGHGQTWKDVSGSRTLNTTYTNSTIKPRLVVVTANAFSGNPTLFAVINGISVNVGKAVGASSYAQFTVIVPSNSTYSITATDGVISSTTWAELS
jgi:hypothetical protein